MKIQYTNGELIRYPDGDPRGYYISADKCDVVEVLTALREKVTNGTGDCCFGIEGPTDSGKTTLSNFIGYILTKGKYNPDTDLCTGLLKLVSRIKTATRGDYIALEEAQGVLTAGTGKALKLLIEMIKVCRTKGVFLAIITPSFMELKRYVVIDRSLFMIRTYFRGKKKEKGFFIWYNEVQKAVLYEKFLKRVQNMYKTSQYSFVGRFGDFDLYPRDSFKDGIMEELERRASEIEGKKNPTQEKAEDVILRHKVAQIYDKIKNKEITNKRDFYKFMGYTSETFRRWRELPNIQPDIFNNIQEITDIRLSKGRKSSHRG